MAKNSAINKDVEALATLTDAQTLTNKTLTSPKIADNDAIYDTAGTPTKLLSFQTTASAVDYAEITNAAAGGDVIIAAVGASTDIDLSLVKKGAGKVMVGTDEIATLTATQALTNKTITLAADPSATMHAATKQYVDALVNGLKWHESCRCATTATITISTALNAGDNIDGVTLVDGDRVLVKDQSDQTQNGIYTVAASPARSTAEDTGAELASTAYLVREGTVNGNFAFVCAQDSITIGATSITFVQMSGSAVAHDLVGATHTLSGGTAGKIIRATGATSFGWTTLTVPDTLAINELLYASSANVLAAVAAMNNAVLVTGAGGIPAFATTLPSVTLTNPIIGATAWTSATHNHTDNSRGGTLTESALSTISTQKGGTGLTSFNQGDMLYFVSGTTLNVLAKDTNVSRFLKNSGTNNAPAWGQISLAVSTDTTGTLPATRGGTGQATWVAGDVVVATGTDALGAMTKGSNNTFLGVNGSGTLGFYAAGGGISWSVITADLNPAVVNTGYIVNLGTLVTVTLPSTAAVGSVIRITGLGAGGWKLAQPASTVIHFGSSVTTTGTGGYLQSNQDHDAVELVCAVANTTWIVVSSVGNITVT